jgi:CheY-like chemotaxis protein
LPALDPASIGTASVAVTPRMMPASQRRRVLVVDDNRDAAESLAALLTLLQHETRQVHDGAAAIAATQEFQPDVVFMDIGMPFMSGLEAARAIRRMPLARQPTIVALTGWSQDADRERSHEAGIDQHLVKPIELDALRRVLALPELADS